MIERKEGKKVKIGYKTTEIEEERYVPSEEERRIMKKNFQERVKV